MTTDPDNSQGDFAKIMAAACVRRGYLEKLHAGITPVTRTGDYSDVKVIDPDGREIPWNQVSRINQTEMKMLITGVVNRLHTFLVRTFYCGFTDKAFQRALDRTAAPWTNHTSGPPDGGAKPARCWASLGWQTVPAAGLQAVWLCWPAAAVAHH